ncbi:hypothetical protein HDF24_00660 [Mucilaginibacter sp. X4EP1]|uniref:hypothetical protein n=1 Tax=Mucilaginibacter sp. X4EP1 TaxID=2723092 RepID=UPI0021691E0C|nr:hypothetical protein [Mucilaginibacter sp. X4EP1]MCS3811523.1 hypothetical protein [Mucilaginibacter sp. X4EP1]
MKRINFTNTTAQKIYDDYFKRVGRCIKILSADDQLEISMELNSHVYEAIQGAAVQDEIAILVDTLEKLGPPEEVLQPLVAEKKVAQAGRSFNPKHIIQALFLNVNRGAAYFLIALGYLLIISFGSLIIFKLISPSHTGLFVKDGHFYAFGHTSIVPPGASELLGNSFIFIVILLMGLFYFINTMLFRLMNRK